jgi:DNA-binding response OmpR family regulator
MATLELYLIAADPALRMAIAEQFKLFAGADIELHESANLSMSLSGLAPAAVIFDAPLANKKSLKILCDMQRDDKKLKIFVLGEIDADAEENLVTESFAKPLRLGHLLARVHFYLQAARLQGAPLTFGPFRLEPQARQIVALDTGATIRLTEKETHLLEYLGRSEKPISREELLAAIWGYDARIDTHTLETHIYRLRRKLDPEGHGDNPILVADGAYRLMAASS